MNRRHYLWLPVALAAVWLAGCAGLTTSWETPPAPPAPEFPTPAPAEPPAPEPPPVAEPVPEPALGAAAASLHAQAGQAQAVRNFEQAAELLERALRIEPHNAQLWYDLAVVHHHAGNPVQAENFALRSLEFAANYPDRQRANWELIATVREYRGDMAGMAEARAQIATLQNP